MDEKKLLSDEFQSVVADAAAGRQFSSDVPRARKAYAIHAQLLASDPAYKEIFEEYRNFGDSMEATKISDELTTVLDESNEGNQLKTTLKAAWVFVSHLPTFVKFHSYEGQLLRTARPLIERAVQ